MLYVNRMILYVTCTLGFFCILITAALIYQVSNKDDREENEIHSIPDAMCAVSRRSVAPPLCPLWRDPHPPLPLRQPTPVDRAPLPLPHGLLRMACCTGTSRRSCSPGRAAPMEAPRSGSR